MNEEELREYIREEVRKTPECRQCHMSLSGHFCKVRHKSKKPDVFYHYCAACNIFCGSAIGRKRFRQYYGDPDAQFPTFIREQRSIDVELLPEEKSLRLNALAYAQYLRSEHWQEMRMKALKQARMRCQLCNSSKSLQVHHRTYERLGRESLSDLTVLCAVCHARHHGK